MQSTPTTISLAGPGNPPAVETGGVMDIRDLDIVMDSTEDQTSRLQTAINAAISGSFILYIPAGTIYHGALTIAGTVKFRGVGKTKAIFRSNTTMTGSSGLWGIQSGTVIFEDCWLHGNDSVNRVVRIEAGCDVIFSNSKVTNAYGPLAVTGTTCGIICGGGGTFKFVNNSEISDIIAEPDGDATGNIPGTCRGISITKWSSENPPTEVLISNFRISNVLSGTLSTQRNEDADAIAYQSYAQDTKGNVKIINGNFHNIGKRWVKALSPGGLIMGCDGTNESTSSKTMFSIFSINTSDWSVIGNRCVGGAASFFCDVGNPGNWACSRVLIKDNEFRQGDSDPNTTAWGCRALGATSTLCTGVQIEGNSFTNVWLGVQVAGGVVGCGVEENYIEATETGVHIGKRTSTETAAPDSQYVTVQSNVGTATSYGVRWKEALHSKPGINSFNAATPFSSEPPAGKTYLDQFDSSSLYRLNIIGGTIKDMTPPLIVGSATQTTFGSNVPQIQAVDTAASNGVASLSAETKDGTRNRRARLVVDDGNDFAAVDITNSTGGQVPFKVKIGGTTYFQLDGAGKSYLGDPATYRSFSEGNGSPEGVVTARVGATYRRWDGGAGTCLYVKESGTGNTGWKAVVTA